MCVAQESKACSRSALSLSPGTKQYSLVHSVAQNIHEHAVCFRTNSRKRPPPPKKKGWVGNARVSPVQFRKGKRGRELFSLQNWCTLCGIAPAVKDKAKMTEKDASEFAQKCSCNLRLNLVKFEWQFTASSIFIVTRSSARVVRRDSLLQTFSDFSTWLAKTTQKCYHEFCHGTLNHTPCWKGILVIVLGLSTCIQVQDTQGFPAAIPTFFESKFWTSAAEICFACPREKLAVCVSKKEVQELRPLFKRKASFSNIPNLMDKSKHWSVICIVPKINVPSWKKCATWFMSFSGHLLIALPFNFLSCKLINDGGLMAAFWRGCRGALCILMK